MRGKIGFCKKCNKEVHMHYFMMIPIGVWICNICNTIEGNPKREILFKDLKTFEEFITLLAICKAKIDKLEIDVNTTQKEFMEQYEFNGPSFDDFIKEQGDTGIIFEDEIVIPDNIKQYIK